MAAGSRVAAEEAVAAAPGEPPNPNLAMEDTLVKETWGFAWFAVGLSIIVMVSMLLGSPEAGLPAFFCFLPVVFFMIARTIRSLTRRIEHWEHMLEHKDGT